MKYSNATECRQDLELQQPASLYDVYTSADNIFSYKHIARES